jgi:hypothetical protein
MKYAITLPALCLILFSFACMRAGDAAAKTYPVTGTLAGTAVNTTVDSGVAQRIIEGNTILLSKSVQTDLAARLSCHSLDDIPDTRALQEITNDYSTDTAAALLIECLSNIEAIGHSQSLFTRELALRRSASVAQAEYLAARKDQYMVLFVPGWGYLSSGDETGSDLRTPRAIISAMGLENHLVEIGDFGSVEGSARLLVTALEQHLLSGKKIILVSASSGGPIVALALGDPGIANHSQLVGWLNICGVLRGTPVIDTFTPWPKSLVLRAASVFEGWKYSDLLSLSQASSTPRYASFVPPPQMTIVNYIGIPFSGQVSELGAHFYRLLKAQGPNDGLTFITDALAPGYTVMAVGSDHFVSKDPDIDAKTAALVPTLLKLIEG